MFAEQVSFLRKQKSRWTEAGAHLWIPCQARNDSRPEYAAQECRMNHTC